MPNLPSDIQTIHSIETPEGVHIEYEIAGIGSRSIAYIIDLLIRYGFLILLWFVINYTALLVILVENFSEVVLSSLIFGVFFIQFLYFLLFEAFWNGQTPGKRVMGVRVISISGRPIGLMSSGLRNLVRVCDLLPAFYVAGLVTMFISTKARRLGDFAAGTVVTRERRRPVRSMVKSSYSPAAWLVSGGLTPEQRTDALLLIREYLIRLPWFSPAARKHLTGELYRFAERHLIDGSDLPEMRLEPEVADATGAPVATLKEEEMEKRLVALIDEQTAAREASGAQ